MEDLGLTPRLVLRLDLAAQLVPLAATRVEVHVSGYHDIRGRLEVPITSSPCYFLFCKLCRVLVLCGVWSTARTFQTLGLRQISLPGLLSHASLQQLVGLSRR